MNRVIRKLNYIDEKNKLFIFNKCLLITNIASGQEAKPLKVEEGLLQGAVKVGLTIYKGILFAAPPVGDLRWRASHRQKSGKVLNKLLSSDRHQCKAEICCVGITQDGFGPAAFHSFSSTLKIDGLSGDYGPNFFGYAVNTATYVTQHDEFGWLAFGGNVKQTGDWVYVVPTTASRSRLFIAPLSLWLTLDAESFETVSVNVASGEVMLKLAARNESTKYAYLHVETTDKNMAGFFPESELKQVRGAYQIDLKRNGNTVFLRK